MLEVLKKYWPIIPALVIYGFIAESLNFTQDDAYISYRYVANYLNGHGLVYNIGERIEGFTNFGWTIYMLFWGALGASFIFISKLTGFLMGAGVIVLTYLIGQELFGDKGRWYSFLAVYLVAINQSLAYWSPAGLETATFAFCVMLSLYMYLKRSRWLMFAILMAVWIRPEGALVAGMLVLIEAITERRFPKFSLYSAVLALVLSLPFVGFKIIYYGSIFPNPFYAKTGFDIEQLKSGLEYAGLFFKQFGFYGIGLAIPLVLFKRLSKNSISVLLFVLFYITYITLVGGDVLKVHRFFLPLFGPAAILMVLSIQFFCNRTAKSTQYMILFLAAIPLLTLTYYLPREKVSYFNYYERMFLRRMKALAIDLKESDSTNFSIAVPTIGITGWELLGHDIIDMVGLTDSTIARHSDPPIEGMKTTWKEQKHNSVYILTRAPDYIVFSTSVKPSAPAERALTLYRQFQESYRTVGWFYQADTTIPTGVISLVFKKVRPIVGELKPAYPVEFVEHYKKGLDYYSAKDYRSAIREYDLALKASPMPFYVQLLYQKGNCHMMIQEHETASRLFNQALKQDSLVFEAHKDLYIYARVFNRPEDAALHERWIKKLVPWYWPRLKQTAESILRQSKTGR